MMNTLPCFFALVLPFPPLLFMSQETENLPSAGKLVEYLAAQVLGSICFILYFLLMSNVNSQGLIHLLINANLISFKHQ